MSWAGNSTADKILCLLQHCGKTAGKNLGSSKKVESTSKLICHSSNCPIDLNEDRLQLKNKTNHVSHMSIPAHFIPFYIFIFLYLSISFLYLSILSPSFSLWLLLRPSQLVEPEALVRDEQQWKMPGCILQFPFQTSVLELRRSQQQ